MPVGIRGFDAPDRPETSPRVQAFFADDRGVHRGADFGQRAAVDAMPGRDARREIAAVCRRCSTRSERAPSWACRARRWPGCRCGGGDCASERSGTQKPREVRSTPVALSQGHASPDERTGPQPSPGRRARYHRRSEGVGPTVIPADAGVQPRERNHRSGDGAVPAPRAMRRVARSIRRPDTHFITFRRFSSIHLLACAGSYARIHASIWSMSLPYQRSARLSGCRKRSSTMRSIMPISGA